VDPSRFFPWKILAENGFGHWYDSSSTTMPSGFDPVHALRIIGYRTSDTAAAIQSFKIHFVPQDTTRTLSDENKRILYNLMLKYL
jgi:N-acetylmuramoyl-L-alanine amidase